MSPAGSVEGLMPPAEWKPAAPPPPAELHPPGAPRFSAAARPYEAGISKAHPHAKHTPHQNSGSDPMGRGWSNSVGEFGEHSRGEREAAGAAFPFSGPPHNLT